MDYMHIPGVLPFGGILRPESYYVYDTQWNHDYSYLDKSTTTRYQQEQYQQQLRASREKNHCELCKNNKRRSLATYIRNKSKSNSCDGIHEEEEENIDDITESETEISTATLAPPITPPTSAKTPTKTTIITSPTIPSSSSSSTIAEKQSKPTTKKSRFSFRFKAIK